VPDAVAGLSIGAYPAAVIAGVLAYADAVKLVNLRARLMEAAYPEGYGMTAIIGIDQTHLERLIAQVHGAASPVYLANLNAPTQIVIAGARAALDRVAALAMAAGGRARPVAISVPSHCALLDGAAAELVSAFAGVTLRPPRLRYFSASAARELRDPQRIGTDLARNVCVPVRWHETTVLATEVGARWMVEMAPGNVLTQLASAMLPEGGTAMASETTRADTVARLVERERKREQEGP
jgi:malonate decarboxylase epsilon subunit